MEKAYAWLNDWAAIHGDEDPVGGDYKIVLDCAAADGAFLEYGVDYVHNNSFGGDHDRPLSKTSFMRVWTYWSKKEGVRVREKKNVTTKCESESLRSSLDPP